MSKIGKAILLKCKPQEICSSNNSACAERRDGEHFQKVIWSMAGWSPSLVSGDADIFKLFFVVV